MQVIHASSDFLVFHNFIALSHVSAHWRERIAPSGMRAFREAFEGGDCTEYLTEFAECARVLTHSHGRDASIGSLILRATAHAIMRDADDLAAWLYLFARTYMTPEFMVEWASVREQYMTIRGAHAIDAAAAHWTATTGTMNCICAAAMSQSATPHHYQFLSECIVKNVRQRQIIIGYIFDQYIGCAHSRNHSGEWMEALLARDIAHARAIFPFAPEVTEHIATFVDERRIHIRTLTGPIYCQIGPLFARYLYSTKCSAPIIAHASSDTPEFDTCAREISAACAQVQSYAANVNISKARQTKNANKLHFAREMLMLAAANPDDRAFARIHEILANADCLPCEWVTAWLQQVPFLAFARAIRRMEAAGTRIVIRVGSAWNNMLRELLMLRADDAMVCADVIYARIDDHLVYVGRHSHFIPLVSAYGPRMERILRAHGIC